MLEPFLKVWIWEGIAYNGLRNNKGRMRIVFVETKNLKKAF